MQRRKKRETNDFDLSNYHDQYLTASKCASKCFCSSCVSAPRCHNFSTWFPSPHRPLLPLYQHFCLFQIDFIEFVIFDFVSYTIESPSMPAIEEHIDMPRKPFAQIQWFDWNRVFIYWLVFVSSNMMVDVVAVFFSTSFSV